METIETQLVDLNAAFTTAKKALRANENASQNLGLELYKAQQDWVRTLVSPLDSSSKSDSVPAQPGLIKNSVFPAPALTNDEPSTAKRSPLNVGNNTTLSKPGL